MHKSRTVMISCTEFIPAYSELFQFLYQLGGKEEVIRYWEHIADDGIGELERLVKSHGLRGCFEYWSHTLNEEAADFTMTLDDEMGEFKIEMHRCPSKGRLLELTHMEPYWDYCGHCDLLYRRVLEKLGYQYEYDLSRCGKAACTLKVSEKKESL